MDKKGKSSTELIVAKYGLIGTIVTAVIGLLAAYLGYLGNKAQTERPFSATETAAARLLLTQTDLSETNLVNTPSSSQSPSLTPGSTQSSLNIDEIVRVEKEWAGCPMRHVLPEYIDPTIGVETANEQLRALLQNELQNESLFPLENDNWVGPNYSFTLTSLSSNNEWIILDKKISINVHRTEIPEHSNIAVIGGCGGVMEVRNFPELKLDSDYDDLMIEETYEDDSISKFTLMPGEPELFQIPIKCEAPGVYNLDVRMKVEYMQQDYEVSISVPPYTCPKTYTQWGINEYLIKDASLRFEGNYQWSGKEYLALP